MRQNKPHPFRDLNGNWYKDDEDFQRRAWKKVKINNKIMEKTE